VLHQFLTHFVFVLQIGQSFTKSVLDFVDIVAPSEGITIEGNPPDITNINITNSGSIAIKVTGSFRKPFIMSDSSISGTQASAVQFQLNTNTRLPDIMDLINNYVEIKRCSFLDNTRGVDFNGLHSIRVTDCDFKNGGGGLNIRKYYSNHLDNVADISQAAFIEIRNNTFVGISEYGHVVSLIPYFPAYVKILDNIFKQNTNRYSNVISANFQGLMSHRVRSCLTNILVFFCRLAHLLVLETMRIKYNIL